MKVLFVDDDYNIIKGIEFINKLENDYEIITCSDCSNALSLLKNENDIFLIITDIQMPKMNGIEFMYKVKELNPNIKIIGITAHEIPQKKEEFWFDEIKSKPYPNIRALIRENIA